jgi:hypothetical protein
MGNADYDLAEYTIPWQIPDLDATTVAYYVAPFGGRLTKIQSVLHAAITTADAVLTAKINTVAVTGGVVTIATASSAAGDVDSASPTAANLVKAGDVISIESDGASSSAIATGYFKIDRSASD